MIRCWCLSTIAGGVQPPSSRIHFSNFEIIQLIYTLRNCFSHSHED